MKINIVIPIYNEYDCIFNNIKEINRQLNADTIEHHFILVNDGSKDKSWAEIIRLKKVLGNVTGINLSRNFGKESALSAGLMEVSEDYAVVMDSDLQHPPKLIKTMLKELTKEVDIVEAIKINRGEEGFLYKLASKTFYAIIDKFSGFSLDNSSDFKLMRKRVIDAWKEMGDTNTFFRGMIEWVGYEKRQVDFEVPERTVGTSKFSKFGLVKYALNAITSFSSSMLHLTNLLAFIFFIGAVILGTQTLYNKLVGISATGFSTVILLLLIMGSAILFCLGIIGMYLSKIYEEVKGRPRFLIKDKI